MATRKNVETQYELKVAVAKKTRHCCPSTKRQSDVKEIPQYRANFSKALPHVQLPSGTYITDQENYKKLVKAVYKWKPRAMLEVELGNPHGLKLASASTIFDYELIGKYAGCFTLPLYPSITSAEAGAEMVELYEMALCRDVPFTN